MSWSSESLSLNGKSRAGGLDLRFAATLGDTGPGGGDVVGGGGSHAGFGAGIFGFSMRGAGKCTVFTGAKGSKAADLAGAGLMGCVGLGSTGATGAVEGAGLGAGGLRGLVVIEEVCSAGVGTACDAALSPLAMYSPVLGSNSRYSSWLTWPLAHTDTLFATAGGTLSAPEVVKRGDGGGRVSAVLQALICTIHLC